jgi:hypothetical protein
MNQAFYFRCDLSVPAHEIHKFSRFFPRLCLKIKTCYPFQKEGNVEHYFPLAEGKPAGTFHNIIKIIYMHIAKY